MKTTQKQNRRGKTIKKEPFFPALIDDPLVNAIREVHRMILRRPVIKQTLKPVKFEGKDGTGTKLVLEKAEFDIALALNSLRSLGVVLKSIRDQHLNLERGRTFKKYCECCWGMKLKTAKALIGASETVIGQVIPECILPDGHPRVADLSEKVRLDMDQLNGVTAEDFFESELALYKNRGGKYTRNWKMPSPGKLKRLKLEP
jgi:hypothetical protein